MERREVLRKVMIAGGALSFLRLQGADDSAEAATAAATQFQEGRLSGGKFTGWQALLASTGKAVYGTIYDPNSIAEGHFTGYRVRGEKNSKALNLEFFTLDDLGFSKS